MKRSRTLARLLPSLLVPALLLASLQACDATQARVRPERNIHPATVQSPRTSDIDVEHYAIDVELMPETRRIEAATTVTLRSRVPDLTTVELDFDGLDVYGVWDAERRPLAFEHEGGKLEIETARPVAQGAEVAITVEYGGKPAKGLWFAGEAPDGSGPTHAFTQGECEDSHWWFPCFDHPSDRATSEVRVTMPLGWTSVAPGELVESSVDGNRRIEHWRIATPHPSYLTSLVAGDLVVKRDEWNGIPLTYLAPPAYSKWMDASFEETAPILAFLSDLTGLRYPYPKYSQACVEDFPFGGMENISATTLTVSTLRDERGNRDRDSDGLVAHEAAHQWFGDLLTCNEWSHIWLNESFATYMEWLYYEHSRGVDEFRIHLRDGQEEYEKGDVGAKRRPLVWNVYRDPMDLFEGGQTYPGGASRLHLLRNVLGDAAFFAGLRTYVSENAGRNVVTADFQRAMEEASGADLDTFFRQWIYGAGFPEFVVSWSWDERDGVAVVSVAQRQTTDRGTAPVFEVPVDIEVRDERGSTIHRVELNQRHQEFRLPAASRPTWVRFDKHSAIPKLLDTRKSHDEWLAILADDDDVNGRRDAAAVVGRLAAEATDLARKDLFVAELADRLKVDPVPAVRVAAAKALAVAGGIEARARLQAAAARDADAGVRVAALEGLREWGEDAELARFAEEQFGAAYSWGTMAAAGGLYCAANPTDAYRWLTQKLLLDSPHDALRSRLIAHLGGLREPGVMDQLTGWARDTSASPWTRVAAAKELGKSIRGSGRASEALLALLDDSNLRVRMAAIEALAGKTDYRSRAGLEAYYTETVFPREKRAIESALRKYATSD